MLVVFGFALLIIAIGMVTLFAMFGELSARVAEAGSAPRNATVRPLDQARIGQVPGYWPPSIPRPGQRPFTLIVLSSICSSCADIAAQLASEPLPLDTGLVISTGQREKAEDFIARFGLNQFPHHIDELGEWVAGEFDVRMSPSALVFREEMLAEAYMFNDVAALRTTVERTGGQEGRAAEEEAAWPSQAV